MNSLTAKTVEFPAKVIDILGAEAANDFEQWIEKKFQSSTQSAQSIEIPAKIARQKVNVLMLERVSNMLLADEPYLVEITPNRWVWRVPIDFTHTSYGRVGRVAEIDVDTQYGMIEYTDVLLNEIRANAQKLAQTMHAKSANLA